MCASTRAPPAYASRWPTRTARWWPRWSDDGIGFDVGRALDRSVTRLHLGLDSAAERVRLAGGSFDIESDPGIGTTVRFTLPARATG